MERSKDAKRNMMGKSHTTSILDARMYQVEFAGGEVIEITPNIIAKCKYAQCNSDGVWGRPVTQKTTAG